MTTVSEAFQAAFAHHQRGELAQAQTIYRQILDAEPQHADVWHLLGLVAHQEGRNDEAVNSILRAISLNDAQPAYHNHLGAVYAVVGELEKAEASFRRALELSPSDAQVHYNLAALLNLRGDPQAAIDHYRRAVEFNPRLAEAHFNLGNLLRDREEWPAAQRAYLAAIAARPNYVKALMSMAAVCANQGKIAEAEDAWRQVTHIDQRHVEARLRLGSSLQSKGRLEEAAGWLRAAILLDPRHFEAQNNLGCVYRGLGQLDQAETCFRLALDAKSDFAEAYNNLGSVLQGKKDYAGAEACLQKAIELRPDLAGAYNNLGTVLQSQKQYEAATEQYRRALAMQPDSAETLTNLGSCLAEQGKIDEAVDCLRQAATLDPTLALARYSLGAALHLAQRTDEALDQYGEAIRLQNDYAEAYYKRSFVHLSRGDFLPGWRDYDWRFKCKEYKGRRHDAPRWDGSPLEGRTLLVYSEQGFGDTLQFIRFLPAVLARGGNVFVEVQPALVPLLRASGFSGVIGGGTQLPRFDLQIPLLSLPGVFGTTVDTVPAPVHYLAADPKLLKSWRARLRDVPGFKVGIVWQGNAAYTFDQFRSIPLANYTPLAEVAGVQLVSLQKHAGVEQLAALGGTVMDLGSALDCQGGAFMDTAAVMCNLDLVITSDTAAAHLAGGLGANVWVALSAAPEWRWMNDRADSPWYPTMRLFRQSKLGDWASVFCRMKSELAKLAGASLYAD